jgi:hypothetical protein
MKWTCKRPSKPGFYWTKQKGVPDSEAIVQVEQSPTGLVLWFLGKECEQDLTEFGRDDLLLRWKPVQ